MEDTKTDLPVTEESEPIATPNDTNIEPTLQEYFLQTNDVAVKNLALVFGQSENELIKEFGAYKSKKIYKKLSYFIDTTSIFKDEAVEQIKTAKKQEFNSVCVFPPIISLAKTLLFGSNVKVRALINYPYGEENLKTVKYAVKQAVKQGADELLIAVSSYSIKNGSIGEFLLLLKKIIKKYKTKRVSLIIDSTQLTLSDIESFLNVIKGYEVFSVILKSDCVINKNCLIDAVSVASDSFYIESFSAVSSAENTLSLLLTGVNMINASTCGEIATDLSLKINGIEGEDCQPLDKDCPKEYN